MTKFFMGLVLAGVGFLVWAAASIMWALTDAAQETDPSVDPTPWIVIAVIAFCVMIGGPVLYWFVLPIVGWVRRRGRKEATPSVP